MFKSFEDLEVWKRSCQLAVKVYELLAECKDFSLRDQMQRSAVSMASNIAEGSERTTKEFKRFLSIARGSSAELQTQSYIACKVNIITHDQMKIIVKECKEISKMLYGLANSLKT